MRHILAGRAPTTPGSLIPGRAASSSFGSPDKERTVKRGWSIVRAWLKGKLSKQP